MNLLLLKLLLASAVGKPIQVHGVHTAAQSFHMVHDYHPRGTTK